MYLRAPCLLLTFPPRPVLLKLGTGAAEGTSVVGLPRRDQKADAPDS